jgi:NTP pyrophosphatase (non-canonical NTP hydrolase)
MDNLDYCLSIAKRLKEDQPAMLGRAEFDWWCEHHGCSPRTIREMLTPDLETQETQETETEDDIMDQEKARCIQCGKPITEAWANGRVSNLYCSKRCAKNKWNADYRQRKKEGLADVKASAPARTELATVNDATPTQENELLDQTEWFNQIAMSDAFRAMLVALGSEIHTNSYRHGFWDTPRNDGECIALMHSELSECLESLRHGNPESEHIPGYNGVEEELADVVIRVMDYAYGKGHRLAEAILAKMAFNAGRPYKHGKTF